MSRNRNTLPLKSKKETHAHRPHFTYIHVSTYLYISVINATMLCRWVLGIRIGYRPSECARQQQTQYDSKSLPVGSWHYSHFPVHYIFCPRFNAKIKIASKRWQSPCQHQITIRYCQLHSVRHWLNRFALLFACACVRFCIAPEPLILMILPHAILPFDGNGQLSYILFLTSARVCVCSLFSRSLLILWSKYNNNK